LMRRHEKILDEKEQKLAGSYINFSEVSMQ
jgi:hypothetical protein